MKIDILTLFPEMFEGFLNSSIIKRAREKELVEINIHNIRDYTNDKHNRVDDYPYGGGNGMVLMCQPVIDAIDKAKARVIEVLNTKEYAEEKREKYSELFREIHDGAEKCNNVSALRSFADKADALKIRLMNEMDARDRQIAYAKQLAAQKAAEEAERRAREEGKEITPIVPDPEPVRIKKTKNVTIKNMTNTSSWRLENEYDVDKYLAALRKALLKELEGTDIVNVEF